MFQDNFFFTQMKIMRFASPIELCLTISISLVAICMNVAVLVTCACFARVNLWKVGMSEQKKVDEKEKHNYEIRDQLSCSYYIVCIDISTLNGVHFKVYTANRHKIFGKRCWGVKEIQNTLYRVVTDSLLQCNKYAIMDKM